ncbi:MAG: DUF2828 family protein, partial [Eubacterium sp.]|nr:DUF2828 family protein [Eubacterium sp.]
LGYIAKNEPETVKKNIVNVAEYGRFDDLLVLIGTPCERALIEYYKEQLDRDLNAMEQGGSVSLLAKWLPSINTSNREAVRNARVIARGFGFTDAEYRKTLSVLRSYIKILENNLRERDYTFQYEKQPSKALYKYRKAFIRNDSNRYGRFIRAAEQNPGLLKTETLTPYDVIAPIISKMVYGDGVDEDERRTMDVTWNSLEDFTGSDNSIAVVDGSGSMYYQYRGYSGFPAAVAQSLGIYFAERNKGAFGGRFITFSENPQLVEVKGRDIVEKVRYCMSYDECANTNIAATFDLILDTAVANNLGQEDIPETIYIISDMEFDCCAEDSSLTNFEAARIKFEMYGYKLPQIVFWNVDNRNRQQPVTMNETGTVLVSGCSPRIFSMIDKGTLDPYSFMMDVIMSGRYDRIVA